jgi:hypothetical protein
MAALGIAGTVRVAAASASIIFRMETPLVVEPLKRPPSTLVSWHFCFLPSGINPKSAS